MKQITALSHSQLTQLQQLVNSYLEKSTDHIISVSIAVGLAAVSTQSLAITGVGREVRVQPVTIYVATILYEKVDKEVESDGNTGEGI